MIWNDINLLGRNGNESGNATNTYSKEEARMRFAPVIEERVEGLGTVHITNPVAQTTLLSCSILGGLTETLADLSQKKSPDNPSMISGVGERGSVHLTLGSKNYEIPLDQPLYAVPDGSRDEITADGKFINRIGKIVLDGSRKWAVYDSGDENYCQAYIIAMDDIGGDNGKIDGGRIFCVSNLLPCYGKIHTDGEHITTWEWYAMRPGMGRLDIRVLSSRLASPDEAGLRAWLAEHPITVYYLRQHPVVSEVPSVLEAIRTITTQEGELSCTDPLKPYFSVSYPFNTMTYINREVSKIKDDVQNGFAPCIPEEANGIGTITITSPTEGSSFNRLSICGISKEILQNPEQPRGPTNPAEIQGVSGTITITAGNASYDLETPITLYALPNGTCDEITRDGKLIQRVGKITLTGMESTWVEWDTALDKSRFALRDITEYAGWDDNKTVADNVLCTHLETMFASNSYNGVVGFGAYTNVFYFYNGISANLNEWKAWLSANPVVVYFELAQPIVTDLPKAVNSLGAIQPFEGNITVSGNPVPYLDSIYNIQTKAYIDRTILDSIESITKIQSQIAQLQIGG